MKQSLYNLILTVLAGIALIIPFTGKVHDGRNKWFKGFTYRGWILVFAVVGSVIATYFKDAQAEKDDTIKTDKVKREQVSRDSINRKFTDESNAKIVTTFTIALGKYGLKYDSSEKIIQKLVKDSAKTKETKVYENLPDISICGISIVNDKNDFSEFQIDICCKYALAIVEYANVKIASEANGNLQIVNRAVRPIPNGMPFRADKKLTYFLKVTEHPSEYNFFYFLLDGKYKDSAGTNHLLHDLIAYDVKANKIGVPLNGNYSRILSYFDNN